MKHIRLTVAALVALAFLVGAATALAAAPTFYSAPSIDLLVGKDHVRTPPAVPKVGDTLWGNNGSPVCDPSCDPNVPDNRSPGAVILAGSPPRGQFFSWYRCNNSGCVQAQARSDTINTYVVKPEDAGSHMQFVVSLTNLDCGEVVRQGPMTGYQECRYTTVNGTALSETVLPNTTVALGPDALPTASVGLLYSLPLTATNGTGPYSFTVQSGTLPPGLSLAPSGVVNGMPTTAGTYTFTVQASASGASPGTKAYTLTVGLGLPTLADGVTGVAYSQALSAAGGSGAVTYAVTEGALPDGLSINGDQVVGTPTKQGAFGFTLKATDAAGTSGSKHYDVTIAWPTVTIAPAVLDHAVRGVRYDAALSASGGTPPYSFQLTSGPLPPGLSLRANGQIVGLPRGTEPNAFPLSFTVHDKYGAPDSISYTLDYLAPVIVVTPGELARAVVGQKARIKLKASGGDGPYTFTQTGGRLPDGLRLGAGGGIAGKPTKAGQFRFGVRVTDLDGAFTTVRFTMTVVDSAASVKILKFTR